ncbi:MAG TPA: hypothetical protein VF824_13530 [Thermoanaerobaculia bacterium]|jgi:predicted LPLAT superfamily acyltransferase
MSLFSLIALAFGMMAASADRVPMPAYALIAVARASRRASRPIERRERVRAAHDQRRAARPRVSVRPLLQVVALLAGTAAPRAPGARA